MKSVFEYETFRDFLSDQFNKRKNRNPFYSLRALARDTEVSASRLSEIMSSQTRISIKSAALISDRLGVPLNQKEFLLELVRRELARTADAKAKAEAQIAKVRSSPNFIEQKDFSGVLNHWYYLPLIEFVTLMPAPPLSEVAIALEITSHEIEEALQLLAERGYLERNSANTWEKRDAYLKFESASPSFVIRAFHAAYMRKATEALQTQPIEKRKFLTYVFPVAKEDLESARTTLEKISSEFINRYSSNPAANSVYALTVQLFQIGAN